MKLNEVSFQTLSSLQHSISLAPCDPFSEPEFKVIAFEGTYRPGALGKQDALYILAIAKAAHTAWHTSATLLDFRGLEYTWGDEMLWILHLRSFPPTNCQYPLAVVVGPRCNQALRTLLKADYQQLCFDTIDLAVESTRLAIPEFKRCLREWRAPKQ